MLHVYRAFAVHPKVGVTLLVDQGLLNIFEDTAVRKMNGET